MQQKEHSRLLYQGRTYLKTLRTAVAFYAKYMGKLCRCFGPSRLLMGFISILPLGLLPWTTGGEASNSIIAFVMCLLCMLLILAATLWNRAQNYAYMHHYFTQGKTPQDMSEVHRRSVATYAIRLFIANVALRLPYFAILWYIGHTLSGSNNWVLLLVIAGLVFLLSAYLHVVSIVLEFVYVYEGRPLVEAFKTAFKQGALRWGQLFLVSFFSELASGLMTLACAIPFAIILLALDNAYTLQQLSEEPQTIPTITYILLLLFGTIALAGTWLSMPFALWANTLQCGSVMYKSQTINNTK